MLSEIRHRRTKTLRCFLHGESKMVKLIEANTITEGPGVEWGISQRV